MGSVATHEWSRTRCCATLGARHRNDGASWVLELSGEAGTATSGLSRQELAQLARKPGAEVVVDVTGMAFCDVASAELIAAARRTNPFTVVGATGTVNSRVRPVGRAAETAASAIPGSQSHPK